MRPVDVQVIEHGLDVVARMGLGILRQIVWNVGRGIPARVERDAAIVGREVRDLRPPAAPVAGKLVHEDDGLARSRLLVVETH